jgi:hypothetical protein
MDLGTVIIWGAIAVAAVGMYQFMLMMVATTIERDGARSLLLYLIAPPMLLWPTIPGVLYVLRPWQLFGRDGAFAEIARMWRENPRAAALATAVWGLYWTIAFYLYRRVS